MCQKISCKKVNTMEIVMVENCAFIWKSNQVLMRKEDIIIPASERLM
jgi:hypothetical protein